MTSFTNAPYYNLQCNYSATFYWNHRLITLTVFRFVYFLIQWDLHFAMPDYKKLLILLTVIKLRGKNYYKLNFQKYKKSSTVLKIQLTFFFLYKRVELTSIPSVCMPTLNSGCSRIPRSMMSAICFRAGA